ncbi:hypothetical protein ACTI_33560 [Actinoplanes sp. OR16]|nr:hypothetical protein ACTI_33560 [Actinoplanes sp. OR16]
MIETGWLRGVLHPRRGGIPAPVRPLATLDDAWSRLRGSIWAQDRAIRGAGGGASRVWQLVTAFRSEDRHLGERILASEARVGAAAEDHALVRAVRKRFQYVDLGADEWLADFLAAAHGLPEACRRVIDGFHDDLPYAGVGVFKRLRELLVAADEATYARARDVIVERSAGSENAHLLWAVTYLLPIGAQSGPVERDAHAAAMRYVGEFGNAPVHASGLAAGDLDTLERFLHANAEVGHEFFSGGLFLTGVLDVAGAQAGPVLARMRPGYPFQTDPYYNGLWCTLLAHVEDDAARAALQRERDAGQTWAWRFTDVEEQELSLVREEAPCSYQPPQAVKPVRLEVAVPVAPEIRFREEERENAERQGVHENNEQWEGVPIGRCDTAAVTAWLEHRERWAIPVTLVALALAPRWTHERLMALGMENDKYWVRSLVPLLLLRHGVSHVDPLLAAFEDKACVEAALEAAQPVGHAALAVPMTRAFAVKKLRRPARSWLLRHPEHAAAGVVAMWAADPGDPETARVLRYLDTQGHRSFLVTQAGKRADELIAFLEKEPPVKRVRVPAYLTASPLPTLVPPADPHDFLVQLAACDADVVHPAVPASRDRWTAESRAAFADALFDRWLAAGAPAADGWCMQAVGLIGDDAGARKLASHARQWAGTNAGARAQAVLDALRHRGTDAALIELSLLAERSRFPVFKKVAAQHIEEIAALRGLTSDELADRLVPSLGLSFADDQIVFDHNLMPVGSGKHLTALRKEARASASLHIARMERAMCTERQIPAEIFLSRFARHPWMTHLARRLVFLSSSGVSFRVAEDGSLATADDEPFTLPDDATVCVAHPLNFDVRQWLPVFADYELLQPFPQLDRPIHRDARDADVYIGRKTTYAILRGLERHGWTRQYDAAVQMAKPLPAGARAVLHTDPGWHASDTVDSAPPQTVEALTIPAGLSPVALSELIHDLRVLDRS